ncbi:MAG TPA: tetratricopeptide repeat protein [Clostridia bacterium]|nr:tetratricopeptide repeat protein [Clostridia bacterium]
MNRFNRTDVLRILHITPKQLSGWERAGLVAVGETFSFFDLLTLKKVRDLRAKKVRPAVIRESLEAMQRQVSGMDNPLLEATAYATGSRVTFRHAGHVLDPIAGQFEMEFEQNGTLLSARNVKPITTVENATEFFSRGVALEDDPNTQDEAIAAYRRVVELDPNFAAAYINLGTLFYNRGEYILSEEHYRKAIACDPRYALAYFDLGNVLDETGRLEEAVKNYHVALQLAPTYADAHYNLALAYEKLKQMRKALVHWRAYVKLDTSGPWAVHAKSQIRKILSTETLKVVYRKPSQH